MKTKLQNLFTCLFFFILVFFVQVLGSLATDETLYSWYRTLTLPSFTPPAWIFAPVWTILYISIAISGYFFWKAPSSKLRVITLILWGGQLFFNSLWTFAFFYFMQPIYGAIDIILTIIFVIGAIMAGRFISKAGSYILIPYLLWLIYAMTINFAIVKMN
jgi:translocator protein